MKTVLTLFTAGEDSSSQSAFGELTRFVETHVGDEVAFEVVDVLADPRQARDNRVIATPLLVRSEPPPELRVIGDLSDWPGVLLRLSGGNSTIAAAFQESGAPAAAGVSPSAAGSSSVGESICLLLVDDDDRRARRVCQMLDNAHHDGLEITAVGRLATAVKRLGEGGIDVVLLELNLPDSQGIATLDRLYAAATQGVPIVVMVGAEELQSGISALARGAYDYLIRGQGGADALLRAVRFAIVAHDLEGKLIRERQTQRRIAEESTDGIVVVDDTGVVHYLNSAAEKLLDRSADQLVGQKLGIPAVRDAFETSIVCHRQGGVEKRAVGMRSIEACWQGEQAFVTWLREIPDGESSPRA